MAVPMGTSPFIKSPFARQAGINRRRSTRVEFVVPLILSGRDAKGLPFREESQTKIVNFHGAKVKTTREILVGMQVCIENPQNAATEKAVCVRIEEDVPGENAHYIAVQLIRPGNIWGLENPPADWAAVAASMLGESSLSRVPASKRTEAPPSLSSAPIVEFQAATLEQQSADLVESLLQNFRRQAQALTAAMLQDFEKRMQHLENSAGERVEQRAGKALAEVSTLVDAMQDDMAARVAEQVNLAVDAAERDLRAKVSEILAPLMGVSASISPAKPTGTLPRK
jgi:hypothetical protein